MSGVMRSSLLRLTLARAIAWALLLAGWVGIGSVALPLVPSVAAGFALVALWLLLLGAAARVATGDLPVWARTAALAAASLLVATGLWSAAHGGGARGVLLALLGWAALTALASGVVRSLRLAQRLPPGPPVAAASLGALCAGLVLSDVGDLPALVTRLVWFVAAAAVALALLAGRRRLRAQAGCRAGLFDCSLPAWPAGAWRDALQWPTLLAGLAMLPMMAALPLMANWCRAQGVPPQAMVLLHLAAMFGPALLLRRAITPLSLRGLSAACACLLAAGAAVVVWAAPPFDLLGLALTHGAAWGLAWSGQLWAPARRGQQGASPLRAAAGYALLTLAVGLAVDQFAARGIAGVHVLLGLAAAAAWLVNASARARGMDAVSRTHASPDAHPDVGSR